MMKMGPVETELLHADVQTDMTKLIVSFRNSENTPKKTYIFVTVMASM